MPSYLPRDASGVSLAPYPGRYGRPEIDWPLVEDPFGRVLTAEERQEISQILLIYSVRMADEFDAPSIRDVLRIMADIEDLIDEPAALSRLLRDSTDDAILRHVRWELFNAPAAPRELSPDWLVILRSKRRQLQDRQDLRDYCRLKPAPILVEGSDGALREVDKVEKERAAALEYEEMLRLLASLGLSISVFGHEVKGAKDSLAARMALLADVIAEVGDKGLQDRLERQHGQLQGASDRLFDIGGYIAGLMSSTESRQLRSLSVLGALRRFADQFSDYMHKQGVTFEIDVQPPTMRTTLMHSSELDSVLLNFLTNSIKSMRQAKVAMRRVRMDARADGAHLVIGFEDNGLGIDETSRARVFDAFYTTTMAADDDGIAGPGTGLGLKIVSDIASSYGGEAVVADPSVGYTCRFEFRILAEAASS